MFWEKNKCTHSDAEYSQLKRDAKTAQELLLSERTDHDLAIKKMTHAHGLVLESKEFELNHSKDVQVKKLEKTVTDLEQKVAVLEATNKMLDKIVDLNSDIVDVKGLVESLIKKLPNIDLKSITVNSK